MIGVNKLSGSTNTGSNYWTVAAFINLYEDDTTSNEGTKVIGNIATGSADVGFVLPGVISGESN